MVKIDGAPRRHCATGTKPHLQSRGLWRDRRLLVILDGAQALHKATRAVFGEAALIQRCQVHKLRNILDHPPERQRPWVQPWNHKRVHRVYCALRLHLPRRTTRRLPKRIRQPLTAPPVLNQTWALDFMSETSTTGGGSVC